MARALDRKRVAILVEDEFEQVELNEALEALTDVGARTDIVSPASGKVKGWKHTEWGDEFSVDTPLDGANAEDNARSSRIEEGARERKRLRVAAQLVRVHHASGQKRVTSYESIQRDLKNAGARWVDEEVVVDNGLVTSRNPSDLPVFNKKKMIEEFADGRHAQRRRAG